MPQLSPMLGFLMFVFILLMYFVLLCGVSKKTPFVNSSKMGKSNKLSYHFFK